MGFSGVAAVVLTWALLAQHRALNSNGWDLAWFDQIVWNSAHGRFFANSFAPWNFLGEHVEPILLAFAAVYRLDANVEILLVTQAVVASAAAVPLFFAARSTLASAGAALLLAIAFLIAPQFNNAVLFDFHPEVMAIMSVFATFAFLAQKRPWWALAATASAFLLKEDASLVAVGLAWLFWLYGYRRQAIGLTVVSLAYFAIVTGLVMPYYRGGVGGPQARWSYLGDSGTGIVLGAVEHPRLVVDHLALPGPRRAVETMLSSQGLMLLASPASLVVVPLTAAHLLSEHDAEMSLHLHYGALPVALAFVATTLGIARLATSRRLDGVWAKARVGPGARPIVLAAVVLAAELVAAYQGGPFGLRFNASHYQISAHDEMVRRALRMIPSDASVAAQSGLVPHLSQRREIWEFPPAFGADYVVVDHTAWWQRHGPWSPEGDYYLAQAALPNTGYCLMFERDGLQIWQLAGCYGPPGNAPSTLPGDEPTAHADKDQP